MRNHAIALATVLAVLAPGASALASGRDVINDCTDDEVLTKTYTQKEYRDALAKLPADADQYGNCRDIIARAQESAATKGAAKTPKKDSSTGAAAPPAGGGTPGGGQAPAAPPPSSKPAAEQLAAAAPADRAAAASGGEGRHDARDLRERRRGRAGRELERPAGADPRPARLAARRCARARRRPRPKPCPHPPRLSDARAPGR